MSTIALCIPAYNAAWCLPCLLESAKNQIIPFDEILVYNDCSTDNTEEVALSYGAKVINGIENKGCSVGKNELAKICKSDWIHFHDADDDILPDFTSNIHEWIKENGPKYDVLIVNFNYIDFKSKALLGTANHDKEALNLDPLKYAIENKIVNFGLYERLTFLKSGGFDIDPKVLYNEDNALHQRLAIAGLKFDYLEIATCINYRYEVSMSQSNGLKCALANYHVLEKTANTEGHKYASEIVGQLYNCIASLSVYQNWDFIKKALILCKNLGQPYSTNGNKIFNLLTKVQPFMAVWLREKMIRLFKPQLR